ncbi:Serine/threonine-protein kinase PknB, partial [Durusdinium trenchii]
AMGSAEPASPAPGSASGTPTSRTVTVREALFPPARGDDSDSASNVTGIELGHFVVEERIGRGGMGSVFRAIDRRLDRVVALKILAPDQSRDQASVIRFHNEARAAARLDHDNIARVHYTGEDQGLHFIAFEFVTGTNIRDFIMQKGRLSPQEALNYTLQIADALRQLAAVGVVHRDIKPSNIVVAPTGRAKLVDLGLARNNSSDAREDLTVAGTALGTFDYISPEQAVDARNVDIRSDIYSLGCTLYHMLTGEPPYPRGSMFEKVINHHRPVPPDPSLKNPSVSAPLARVVQKMMASNPDERYAGPDALLQDLVQIAESMGMRPTYPEAVIWNVPLFSSRERRWDAAKSWMAVAVVLLVLVILVDHVRWSDLWTTAALPEVKIGAPGTAPTEEDAALRPPESVPVASAPAMPPAEVVSPDSETPSSSAESGESQGILAGMAVSQRSAVAADLLTMLPGNPKRGSSAPSTVPGESDGTLAGGSTRPGSVRTSPDATENATGSGGSTESPRPAAAVALTRPFVVLQFEEGEEKAFPTLEAACTAAPDDAVIELRFDGRSAPPQSPVRVVNKRLKIRPAPNVRPVLEFRLPQETVLTALSRTARMVSIRNGGLELYDLDVVMWVDSGFPIDSWSMIEAGAASDVVLRGVSLTVANPNRSPAALFELPTPSAGGIEEMMSDTARAPSFRLQMEETVCRGQADLFLQRNAESGEIRLRDTAVAVSGAMLRLDGAEVFGLTTSAESENRLVVSAQHVTALLGEGMLRVDTGDQGTVPTVEVDSRDSIFVLPRGSEAFVAMTGHDDLENFLDRFVWVGHRDANFFEMEGPLWDIRAPQSLILDRRVFDFDEWSRQWAPTDDRLVSTSLLEQPPESLADDAHQLGELIGRFGVCRGIFRFSIVDSPGSRDEVKPTCRLALSSNKPPSLHFEAGKGVRRNGLHFDLEVHTVLDRAANLLHQDVELIVVGVDVRGWLHFDAQMGHRPAGLDCDAKFGDPVELPQDRLDARRKDVDAPNREHVIDSSDDSPVQKHEGGPFG